jgi:hypothetical protein
MPRVGFAERLSHILLFQDSPGAARQAEPPSWTVTRDVVHVGARTSQVNIRRPRLLSVDACVAAVIHPWVSLQFSWSDTFEPLSSRSGTASLQHAAHDLGEDGFSPPEMRAMSFER